MTLLKSMSMVAGESARAYVYNVVLVMPATFVLVINNVFFMHAMCIARSLGLFTVMSKIR